MADKKRKLEYIDIDEIIPYKGNPRFISDNAVQAVKNSIKRFGMNQPIVVDKNNVIIAGHTRLKALQEIGGADKVPVIRAEDLTPDEVKAYRLIDNKTNELTYWDTEQLKKEMDELDQSFGDLSEFGFSENKDVDLDLLNSFFEEQEQTQDNGEEENEEAKEINCPNCGYKFSID